MTNEEMAQICDKWSRWAAYDGLPHDAGALQAGAAALRREPQESVVDAAVTAIYRQFKDWSNRKFSADDVTWCEVKAEILKVVRFEISQDKWRPIEQAPKDGRPFDAWQSPHGHRIPDVYFDIHAKVFRDGEGRNIQTQVEDGYITHYRELPAPPEGV